MKEVLLEHGKTASKTHTPTVEAALLAVESGLHLEPGAPESAVHRKRQFAADMAF